jgi:hypothetical protein
VDSINRREFVKRGGLVVGAVAVGGHLSWASLAQASSGADLNEARLATYRAIISAVGDPNVNYIDPAKADEATTRFSTWYAEQLPASQEIFASVLDNLESGPKDGPFSQMSVSSAHQLIKTWVREPTVPANTAATTEPATLDQYLVIERLKPRPSRTAASCDPESDGSCPPDLPSPQLPVRRAPSAEFGPAALHGYVGRTALELALFPFFPYPAQTGPSNVVL